ncbi:MULTISPECIES: InlB B-repeat-containing protein [Bacillaceae]|uniref:Bacterial repeat domain-containing protein n=1 Tax=Evansella alkalicola TaxID=745819 RepID=A0ABS6JWT7_9BACI|nr:MULTISPECIES: tetratricopeptide repeat protein [Bacillaceae]MBU9723062.1 hypothetical protein [Bacillus alkalicola]
MDTKYRLMIGTATAILIIFMGFFTYNVVSSNDLSKKLELANSLYNLEEYERSIEVYSEILDIDPAHVEARLGLARSYFALASWNDVTQTLQEGIDLLPDETAFYMNLADYYIFQKEIVNAVETIESGIAETEHPELMEQLASMEERLSITTTASPLLVQVGYDRLVEVLWEDDNGRSFPVAADWVLHNEDMGTLNQGDDTYFFAKEVGVASLTAWIGSISLDVDVEVRDQVLMEIIIDADHSVQQIATGETIELTVSGTDYGGEPMDFSPAWTLKKNLGELANESGITNSFVGLELGIETIVISYDDMVAEFHVIIGGDGLHLSFNLSGQGNLVFSPSLDVYEVDSIVTVEAIPADGWEFLEWRGDITGPDTVIAGNRMDLFMDTHKNIEAVFVESDGYTLTVNTNGRGKVESNQGSINSNGTVGGGSNFTHGEYVTLTAIPNNGWKFERWQGSVQSTAKEITIHMDSNKTISAVFVEDSNTNDNESSTDTDNNSRNDSSRTNDRNDSSSNNDTSNTNGSSDSSDSSSSGSGGSQNSDRDTNQPEPKPAEEFTLGINTSGEGTISGSKAGKHEANTRINLTATPRNGWEFDRWEGDVSSTDPQISFRINKDTTVRAVFTREETFTLTITPTDGGTVSPATNTYKKGTEVTVRATPNSGWRFVRWEWNGGSSTNNPHTVTMDRNRTLQPIFEQIEEE